MKGSCYQLRNDLFCFNFIRNVSLTIRTINLADITLSLTPRLRNRAPAKYLDRRAITQTYIERPYNEISIVSQLKKHAENTSLIHKPVNNRNTPIRHFARLFFPSLQ